MTVATGRRRASDWKLFREPHARIVLSRFVEAFERKAVGGARLAGRRAAPLLAWGTYYLPRHFTRPPSGMHRWLEEQIELARCERGLKINAVGPRGGAKSTIGTLALPLRAALEGSEP